MSSCPLLTNLATDFTVESAEPPNRHLLGCRASLKQLFGSDCVLEDRCRFRGVKGQIHGLFNDFPLIEARDQQEAQQHSVHYSGFIGNTILHAHYVCSWHAAETLPSADGYQSLARQSQKIALWVVHSGGTLAVLM